MSKSFFNDQWYNRAKKYVINTITEEELFLYRDGKITKIYSSFEEMLLDNINSYSRIIRSILWLYENIIVQDGQVITKERKVKYKIPMSCTKFYYMIMCNNDFTRDEIFYGFPQLGKARGKDFKGLFRKLTSIGSFAFNVIYTTEKYNTKSFTKAFSNDITDNDYLYKICNFQYDNLLFIEKHNLNKDISNLVTINENFINLYRILLSGVKSKRSTLNILPNRLEYKSINGLYTCSFSEKDISKSLTSTHKELIDFDNCVNENIKYLHKFNNKNYSYTLSNLRLLCTFMIDEYKTNFTAIKHHPGTFDYSICTFKKYWNVYECIETKYNKDGNELYKNIIKTGINSNTTQFLFNNGYYIFGESENINNLYVLSFIDNPSDILNYYDTYINQRFMSSKYKLEILKMNTEKIVNFLIKSYSLR